MPNHSRRNAPSIARRLRYPWKVVALGVFLVSASAANATTITWTLNNVAFTSGGSASGSFDYDRSALSVTNVAIAITADGSIPATTLSFAYGTGPSDFYFINTNSPNFAGATILRLTLVAQLGNSGGTVAVSSGIETLCVSGSGSCAVESASIGTVSGGSLTGLSAAPESATQSLLLLGLLLVSTVAARKRLPNLR